MKKIIDVFEVADLEEFKNGSEGADREPGVYLQTDKPETGFAVLVDSEKFGWSLADTDCYKLFKEAPDYPGGVEAKDSYLQRDLEVARDLNAQYSQQIVVLEEQVRELQNVDILDPEKNKDELGLDDLIQDEAEPEHVFVIREQARRLNLYERIIDALLSERTSF